MPNDAEKIRPHEQMTNGEIFLWFIICTVSTLVFNLIIIICIVGLMGSNGAIANRLGWGAGMVVVSVVAMCLVRDFAVRLRKLSAKLSRHFLWILLGLNVGVVLFGTILMLNLMADDGNSHPFVDAVSAPLEFPCGDSDMGLLFNSLFWGFLIVYGCRFVVSKIKTRIIRGQQ